LPVSAKLRTPEAMRAVGPSAFGLETSYVSPLPYNGKRDNEDYPSIADMIHK